MIKYEYKTVKGYAEKKFIENGHTMFESDVLRRLERLAYLEDNIKNEKSKTIGVVGSCGVGISTLAERLIDLNNPMEKEGFHVAIIEGKEDKFRNAEIDKLLSSIAIEPLRIEDIAVSAPLFLEKENKNYPNPYSKKNKGFKK